MEYPESVVTKSKKGVLEARILMDKGEFVRYKYKDIKTGKEDKKYKIVLKKNGEIVEEYFVIPLKDGRFLMIESELKGKRKVWDPEKEEEVEV